MGKGGAQSWIPGLRLFRGMRPITRSGSIRDSIAGIELAALSIPQALGYSAIARMPAITGFYTLFLPLLAFAAFGSSSYMVVAADSATAAILAGGISPIAPAGSPRYVALAGAVALLTAGLLIVARVLRLGFLADFLSRTVLLGFLTGVGFQVGIAVLGDMLRLQVHSRRAILQLGYVIHDLPHTHVPSLGLSALVIFGVLALDRFRPRIPGPLIAVAGAIAASAAWNFGGHGFAVIGPIAGGLPHFGLPDVRLSDLETLVPVAASCFLMIVAQSGATARIYAIRHQQIADENADLTGLAAANAAAALSGTFVVNGSPTQTAMAERSGGRTQMTHVAAAAVVAFVLLFLTSPFQYLPRCVLGAIVFIVAIRLVDLRGLAGIRKESPGEFWLAVITAVVVVGLGVEQGIILAMVLSLLRIVRHSYRPQTAVLVPGEGGMWESRAAVAGMITEPGLIVYRFGAALFYANVGRFADQVRELAASTPSPLRWLIVDAGAITHMDYTAAQVVRDLVNGLARRGIGTIFAHVEPDLRSDLDRHHITEAIGPDHIFEGLHKAIRAFEVHTAASNSHPV
jgi:MFS superfamily sulfate permease-like transporter